MVHIFLDLGPELIEGAKRAVVSDDVHDVHMQDLPIDITIEPEDMNLKMSFFALIGSGSQVYLTLERHAAAVGFFWYGSGG